MIVALMGSLFAGCSTSQLSSLLQEPVNNQSKENSNLYTKDKVTSISKPQEVYKPKRDGFKGEQYFTFKHTISDESIIEQFPTKVGECQTLRRLGDIRECETTRKCKTPQDKMEGCVEITSYKLNEKSPYDKLSVDEILNAIMKNYEAKEGLENQGVIEHENVIAKYFENNQIEEMYYSKRTKINRKWRIDSDKTYSTDNFFVRFLYKVAENLPFELVDIQGSSKKQQHSDGISCNSSLLFYKKKELSSWLKDIKECQTKADMKGTCKLKHRARESGYDYDALTIYNNGNKQFGFLYNNMVGGTLIVDNKRIKGFSIRKQLFNELAGGYKTSYNDEIASCVNIIKEQIVGIDIDLLKSPSDWLK